MEKQTRIPPAILKAATTILQQYVPELTEQSLNAAILQQKKQPVLSFPIEKKLTRSECATLLGVSVNSVNRYIKNGRLKAVNISPRLVRIDPESVRFLLNHGVPEEEIIIPQCHGKEADK